MADHESAPEWSQGASGPDRPGGRLRARGRGAPERVELPSGTVPGPLAWTGEQDDGVEVWQADETAWPSDLGPDSWAQLYPESLERRFSRSDDLDWALDPDPSTPSMVRPYARTGGRTRPVRDFEIEALVITTEQGHDDSIVPLLSPEHATVVQLCHATVSVAEISARLSTPIGVARVIIADMVELGLVEVMGTSADTGDERDPTFLRRVLSGLQRL